MSKASDRRRRAANRATNAIIDELFVNGIGEEADRLVLTSKDGRDLGGLCKDAVIDRVRKVILATMKEEATT